MGKGLHEYRFNSNPHERIAAELWEKERVLRWLLSEEQHDPPTPSDRDQMVAATLIQWLGSPVGRCFLTRLNEAFADEGKRQRMERR